MKFETWDLRLLRVFFSPFAIMTDEMEVLLFGFCLGDAQTRAVLPNTALVACHAMGTIVLSHVSFCSILQPISTSALQGLYRVLHI